VEPIRVVIVGCGGMGRRHLFESSLAGRLVMIAEVETSAVDAYQREIDEYYGLLA
jgi:predicted dehydrogenase